MSVDSAPKIINRSFSVPHADGFIEEVRFMSDLPADRTQALRLITRFVMGARDPKKLSEPWLVPATEWERDCAEALQIIRRVDNQSYVGEHTKARDIAVEAICNMCPEMFELEAIGQAPVIPVPRPSEEVIPVMHEAA